MERGLPEPCRAVIQCMLTGEDSVEIAKWICACCFADRAVGSSGLGACWLSSIHCCGKEVEKGEVGGEGSMHIGAELYLYQEEESYTQHAAAATLCAAVSHCFCPAR